MVDCRVVMLPVGQGAMNLIEIYDGGKLVNLTMIDCGGDDGNLLSKAAREKSLNYAAVKMSQRFENSKLGIGNFYLDNLILTHRDIDHWNMLDVLWKKVTGDEEDATSEDTGFLAREDGTGGQEVFFVNKNTDVCFYQITVCDEYTMVVSISHRENGISAGHTVEFECSYEESRLHILFGKYLVEFNVLQEDTAEGTWRQQVSIFSIFHSLYLSPGFHCIKDDFQTPQDIGEFIALFDWLYPEYLAGITGMPPERLEQIRQLLGRIWVSKEEIEGVVFSAPYKVPSFIRNTYIGGNFLSTGKQFNRMMQIITAISNEISYAITVNQAIPLYAHLELYIIQQIGVFSLEPLPGAASARSGGIKNNATSIVSALVSNQIHEGQKVVFSGDATVHTFYRMLSDLQEKALDYYYENAIWTAPHHGSTATCIGMLPDESGEVFAALLREVVPAGMVISAGVENRHGHPGNYFIMKVGEALQKSKAKGHVVYDNMTDQSKRLGAVWKWLPVQIPLYSTYTVFPPEDIANKKYAAYLIPFLGEGIETVPVENLREKAKVGNDALRIGEKEQLGSGMPRFSEKEEIPSKELFFCR